MHPKLFTYHDEDYEKWIREEPCLVCRQSHVDCHHVYHAKRNSYLSIPLCREHHTMSPDSYHRLGVLTFQETHSIHLDWELLNLNQKYLDMLVSDPKRGF